MQRLPSRAWQLIVQPGLCSVAWLHHDGHPMSWVNSRTRAFSSGVLGHGRCQANCCVWDWCSIGCWPKLSKLCTPGAETGTVWRSSTTPDKCLQA